MKQYELNLYGTIYKVKPVLNQYANGLLYLEFIEVGSEELIAVATVNLGEFISILNAAHIDTNNHPNMVEFLEENGFGVKTDLIRTSGFCKYPIFLFNEDILRGINNGVYQNYIDNFERYLYESIDQLII